MGASEDGTSSVSTMIGSPPSSPDKPSVRMVIARDMPRGPSVVDRCRCGPDGPPPLDMDMPPATSPAPPRAEGDGVGGEVVIEQMDGGGGEEWKGRERRGGKASS